MSASALERWDSRNCRSIERAVDSGSSPDPGRNSCRAAVQRRTERAQQHRRVTGLLQERPARVASRHDLPRPLNIMNGLPRPSKSSNTANAVSPPRLISRMAASGVSSRRINKASAGLPAGPSTSYPAPRSTASTSIASNGSSSTRRTVGWECALSVFSSWTPILARRHI
jgi:hypothetical protein